MSNIPVIAVDGPSGSGKGVVTSHLAERYGFHILDSGALYRLVGIAARNAGLALENPDFDQARVAALAATLDVSFDPTGDPENPLSIKLDGTDVTLRLRSDEAGVDASRVASIQALRDNLGDLQRSFRRAPGLVADGRDMGTAIFPDADAKIFLTASAEARAERRYNQLKHKDIGVSLAALFQSIQARDERDMSREASPLRPADDALVVDSTDMTIEEVLESVQAFVSQKLNVSD
jgi:cytidylate kinase